MTNNIILNFLNNDNLVAVKNQILEINNKSVFYGEYEMDKLNILKVLSEKIEINHEWESFYIDYLKSLSKEKLRGIEKLINEKI